jgi:hypothetical protein
VEFVVDGAPDHQRVEGDGGDGDGEEEALQEIN